MSLGAHNKGVEIVLDLAELEISTVKSDPGRIRQILTNIISNAIKFTEHGEIAIVAKLSPTDNKNESQLQCQIRDTGIGIPDDKLATLFDVFSQVDASTTRKYGGTGLGLSITKRLCQLLKGDIEVSSQVGAGSDFKVSCIVETHHKDTHIDLSSFNLKVLLIDANKSSRVALSKQLSLWGVHVTSAADSLIGISEIKELHNNQAKPFDIILFDKHLPLIQGEPLSSALRMHTQNNKAILTMMGRLNEQFNEDEISELGIDAYFHKPMIQEELLKTLSIGNKEVQQFLKSLNLKVFSNEQESQNNKQLDWTVQAHVLLVEDNKVNQLVALKVLSNIGVSTDVAENGRQAIEKLKSAPSDKKFTSVLMDCQMPVMDGYQATQAIRLGQAGMNNISIPIIAMTANAMQGDKQKCLDAGMNDYITKPIVQQKIIEKLKEWTAKSFTL
jgi:CheY-like chemotaxis protein